MSLDLDKTFKEFQRILGRHPVLVVGTGASCALDTDFGMPALADKLRAKVTTDSIEEEKEWNAVLQELDNDVDLEHALDAVKSTELLTRIVAASGRFVAELDRKWGWTVATGTEAAPLAPLLKKLIAGLPPSYPIQHVITPNYDMMIEHTCDALQVPWIDGFVYGATSMHDWRRAELSMLDQEQESRGRRIELVTRRRPHMRLHKVHGSINWFFDTENTRFLRCDAMAYQDVASDWQRAMITPGKSKNEQVALNRDLFFREADGAVKEADAFLIAGYGFNDNHIQAGIRRRLQNEGIPGIIVTMDWSSTIEEWIRGCSDLWAVCKLAGGGGGDTMIVGPSNVDDPLICHDEEFWKIDVFANSVM